MSETAIRNISLNVSKKERFTINGDENDFIELNTGDMGITARLALVVPRLNALSDKYEKLVSPDDVGDESDEDTAQRLSDFGENFNAIDKEIREIINELFDYDVCSVCAKGGSMLDLQDGEYRFSVIINTLLTLYESTISEEVDKLVNKMKKHTDKYTTKDHQRRKKQ